MREAADSEPADGPGRSWDSCAPAVLVDNEDDLESCRRDARLPQLTPRSLLPLPPLPPPPPSSPDHCQTTRPPPYPSRFATTAFTARPPCPSLCRPCCSALLDAAACVGIDAEWDPADTEAEARSGGPPHATLVQLSLWLPPGCCAGGDGSSGAGASSSGSCLVLLLDMMALPQAAAKAALQRLFRRVFARGGGCAMPA